MSPKETFEQIRSECEKIVDGAKIGIPSGELIAFRILVARLGETDNNRWWNMAILSPFGRQHLVDFLPTTLRSKRMVLAFSACAKAERRLIPAKNCISLFNLGFDMERNVAMLLSRGASVESAIHRVLDLAESVNCTLNSPGWNEELGYGSPIGHARIGEGNVTSLSLGTLSDHPDRETWARIVRSLFVGYGHSYRGWLIIPYYEVKVTET